MGLAGGVRNIDARFIFLNQIEREGELVFGVYIIEEEEMK